MGKAIKRQRLVGDQRKVMVGLISDPMQVWLRTMARESFPHPQDAEATDIMAEGIADAVRKTLGPQASKVMAMDILQQGE